MPEPASISAGPCRLYELANCVLMLCAKDIVFIIFFHPLCSVVVLTCFVIPKIIRILLICFVIISLFLRLCICHLPHLLVFLSSIVVVDRIVLCCFLRSKIEFFCEPFRTNCIVVLGLFELLTFFVRFCLDGFVCFICHLLQLLIFLSSIVVVDRIVLCCF
jgi:hypothetical protein